VTKENIFATKKSKNRCNFILVPYMYLLAKIFWENLQSWLDLSIFD